jgi:hypothetical protein
MESIVPRIYSKTSPALDLMGATQRCSVEYWHQLVGPNLWFPTAGVPFDIKKPGMEKTFQALIAFHLQVITHEESWFLPIGFSHKGTLVSDSNQLQPIGLVFHLESPHQFNGHEYSSVLTVFGRDSKSKLISEHSCLFDWPAISVEEALKVYAYAVEGYDKSADKLSFELEKLATASDTGSGTGYKNSLVSKTIGKVWPSFAAALDANIQGRELLNAFFSDYYKKRSDLCTTPESSSRKKSPWNPIVDLFLVCNWHSSGVYKMSDKSLETLVEDRLGIQVKGRTVAKRLMGLGLSFDRSSGPDARGWR